jgi:hypothetical protein
MGLLALFETPAGYALFNVLDNKKMSKVCNFDNHFARFSFGVTKQVHNAKYHS